MALLDAISSIFQTTTSGISSFIQSQGYFAILVLMTLEGSSLPIPSEIVIPAAGYFAAQGLLNPFIAFAMVLLGSIFGLAIDYGIGFFIGKEVIYRHLRLFRVKKETLEGFDSWFARNGAFAVFVTRFIPEVRALMSFPAGFARMPLKKFFFWSILGNIIWGSALFAFGYYLLSVNSIVLAMAGIGIFGIVLYLVYRLFMRKMKRDSRKARHG